MHVMCSRAGAFGTLERFRVGGVKKTVNRTETKAEVNVNIFHWVKWVRREYQKKSGWGSQS